MPKVEFSGHSDDIIQFGIDGKDDEAGAWDKPNAFLITAEGAPGDPCGECGHPKTAKPQRMAVLGYYGEVGTWMFAPGIASEDEDFPDWPVSFSVEHGYSLKMTVEIPDGLTVTVVELGKDDDD